MNRKRVIKVSFFFILIFVSSCVRDGANLDECIRNMRIELRWINTEPVNDDERVHIEIIPSDNNNRSDIASDIYGVNVDLLTGGYHIVGWEDYTQVDLNKNNNTLAVHTASDGSALSPTVFSAGSTTTEVTLSDESIIIPLPLYRQVRPLIIQIHFVGDGYSLVDGVAGTLNGIALERNLGNGFPLANGLNRPTVIRNGNIQYDFQQSESEEEGLWFTGSKNLLGIDGNTTQNLRLAVSFINDNETSAFDFDVTEQLAEFHTQNVNEPWYVIITLNMGITMEVEIVDWIAGPESIVIAH